MSHDVNIGMTFQGISKSAVSLHCRRRSAFARYLHYVSPLSEARNGIFAHQSAYLIVVCTHEGSVFLDVDSLVKDDYWDVMLLGIRHMLGNLTILLWRHNEQIHANIHERINLSALFLYVKICIAKHHIYVIIEVRSLHQFLLKLQSPSINRALRHSDNIFLLLCHA